MNEMTDQSGSYRGPTVEAEEEEEGDLPVDFDRLWKVVSDNPQDFNSWTELLQYCEQEVRRGSSVK